MSEYCHHDSCRSHAIQELRWIGKALGWASADTQCAETTIVRSMVRCRQVERKGAVKAPFPPKGNNRVS